MYALGGLLRNGSPLQMGIVRDAQLQDSIHSIFNQVSIMVSISSSSHEKEQSAILLKRILTLITDIIDHGLVHILDFYFVLISCIPSITLPCSFFVCGPIKSNFLACYGICFTSPFSLLPLMKI